MSNVDKYLQKVADATEDPEMKDGLQRMLDVDVYDDLPWVRKPKSSFKDANKKMKDIEDKAKGKNEDD